MDEIEWWEFESQAELATQAAGDIAFIIQTAIEAHGDARIAVPGGSTADLIHGALVKRADIDWSKLILMPTGDRLVPLDDELSHYRRIESFYAAKGATIISLVDESALGDYREAGRLADARLDLLRWPLDLVWLGMSEEGNSAAIFPGPDFDNAISGPRGRRAVGLRPDPMPAAAPVDRVTLTAAALSSARAVMIVIAGDAKKEMLEQAIQEGPLSSRPIGRILAEIETAVDILWSPE